MKLYSLNMFKATKRAKAYMCIYLVSAVYEHLKKK